MSSGSEFEEFARDYWQDKPTVPSFVRSYLTSPASGCGPPWTGRRRIDMARMWDRLAIETEYSNQTNARPLHRITSETPPNGPMNRA
jgi:hypothetical protein